MSQQKYTSYIPGEVELESNGLRQKIESFLQDKSEGIKDQKRENKSL